MSVYDINALPQDYAYDITGNALEQAYDIEANPLLSTEPKPFAVMTYNVQWFERINSQTAMQQSIINNNNPYFIGFQEFAKTKAVPSVGQQVLGDYPYIVLSDHANYMAVASKLKLHDITIADFSTQDPAEAPETRAYMKGYFYFNDKRVCFINTHLSYMNMAPIYGQMAEVFALAEQEDYVIITGDFNTGFQDFNNVVYENTFKQFVEAGYNLVNNSPTAGITKTFCSGTTATSLNDFNSNPDSIIVSGNIAVNYNSRVFDTTKLQYLDGNPIDHIAVVATLLI